LAEKVCVEHLVAEAFVETFDVAVLHRPAWLDVMQTDVVVVAPGDEFR